MKYLLALLPLRLLVDAAPANCDARPSRRPRPSGWHGHGHKGQGQGGSGRPSASVAPVPQDPVGGGASTEMPPAVPTTTAAVAPVETVTTATIPAGPVQSVTPPPEEEAQPQPIVADENPIQPDTAGAVDDTPRPRPTTSTSKAAPRPTSAAPSPSASSVPSAAPAPAPAPPTSGVSPVGLAMNYESKANIGSFGGNIGWYYSWNLDPLPNTAGLEFVPMIHGADMVESFTGKVPAGTKSILGFNEPDIGKQNGGSNIAAGTAADLHKKWTAKVPAGIRIGSPSVARGGKKWMDEWLAACGGGCKFDFVPFHFYGGPGSAKDLITYAQDFHATYGKPLWVTEWACHDYSTGVVCNADQVKEFMQTAIGWFRGEGKGIVERWSYFGAFPDHAATNANGLLNPDGGANAIGSLYASL